MKTDTHLGTTMKHLRLMLAALAAVACTDSTSSEAHGVPGAELTTLLLPADAPALCADSAGDWFHRRSSGGPEEIALSFPEDGDDCNGGTEDFLRLRLDRRSLKALPDGTPIAVGDSVFISVKWVGNDSVLFELSPSGLAFSADHQARLKIKYGKLHGDLNDDGQQDEQDDAIERRLDMFRQEAGDTLWFKLGTVKLKDDDELEARLTGFSRYMIAY